MQQFLRPLSDWVCFCVVCLVTVFLFFDEEPFLDPSDWNIAHVLLLLISLLVVTNENIVRARYGQFVYKDQVLMFSTFSFWFAIENWSRAIVIIFCFHCLVPLESDLVELTDIFLSLQSWLTTSILPFFLWVVVIYSLLLLVNFYLNWTNVRVCLLLVFLSIIILLVLFLTMLWDFVLSSLSGFNFTEQRAQLYYNNTRGGMSYDAILGGSDFFDWHVSNANNFTFRYEDTYCFFLQLFNMVAMYSALFVLFMWFFDWLNVSQPGEVFLNRQPSFTFFGVSLRWMDHVFWSFFISHLSVFFVGIRIFFKVCLDFNF